MMTLGGPAFVDPIYLGQIKIYIFLSWSLLLHIVLYYIIEFHLLHICQLSRMFIESHCIYSENTSLIVYPCIVLKQIHERSSYK